MNAAALSAEPVVERVPELATQAQFARIRGITPPMVTKLKGQGRLVMADDGRVRVRESIALVEATRDPGRGGDRTANIARLHSQIASGVHGALHARAPGTSRNMGAAPNAGALASTQAAHGGAESDSAPGGATVLRMDDSTYLGARTRETRARAESAEIDLALKAGTLVVADVVRRELFARVRAAREALTSIPDRLSVQAAALSDALEVHALLSAEIRRVCEQLSGQPAAEVVTDA